jgi:hypothetical protein
LFLCVLGYWEGSGHPTTSHIPTAVGRVRGSATTTLFNTIYIVEERIIHFDLGPVQ